MSIDDAYRILDIDRGEPLTKEKLKSRRRKKQIECHPDINGDNKENLEKSKDVNDAYELLLKKLDKEQEKDAQRNDQSEKQTEEKKQTKEQGEEIEKIKKHAKELINSLKHLNENEKYNFSMRIGNESTIKRIEEWCAEAKKQDNNKKHAKELINSLKHLNENEKYNFCMRIGNESTIKHIEEWCAEAKKQDNNKKHAKELISGLKFLNGKDKEKFLQELNESKNLSQTGSVLANAKRMDIEKEMLFSRLEMLNYINKEYYKNQILYGSDKDALFQIIKTAEEENKELKKIMADNIKKLLDTYARYVNIADMIYFERKICLCTSERELIAWEDFFRMYVSEFCEISRDEERAAKIKQLYATFNLDSPIMKIMKDYYDYINKRMNEAAKMNKQGSFLNNSPRTR